MSETTEIQDPEQKNPKFILHSGKIKIFLVPLQLYVSSTHGCKLKISKNLNLPAGGLGAAGPPAGPGQRLVGGPGGRRPPEALEFSCFTVLKVLFSVT